MALPQGYTDILTAEWDDRGELEAGCHYDYQRQAWVDGHDHAHMDPDHNTADDLAPLMFCGMDATTCQHGYPEAWAAELDYRAAGN